LSFYGLVPTFDTGLIPDYDSTTETDTIPELDSDSDETESVESHDDEEVMTNTQQTQQPQTKESSWIQPPFNNIENLTTSWNISNAFGKENREIVDGVLRIRYSSCIPHK
jgi:hypothetical protein